MDEFHKKRINKLKQQFEAEGKEFDINDERKWYTPKFFIKTFKKNP
jgi:hypothetical protein